MLPLFLDLSEQACLVVGAGRVAERKIGALLAAGASVTVVALDATSRIRELANEDTLNWLERAYRDGDARDYFLTVGATSDESVNERVSRDAREAGRLVNVVDAPDLSTVYMAAVAQRGELQIAVSTSGACPALAKLLRGEMEGRFPESYGPLLGRLRLFRADLRDAIADPAKRKAIIERIVRSDELARFIEGDEAPLEDLLTRCVS